ncbi:DUF4129 domain-containing protein [Litorihabitans aurantiacus]|uniref:Protein-glutamine gamma-glutamyltransferase-like C-terminal domain-containing protein n=1 Tax=Litorihabitans aurantiacus TaxID=1930061 RepID=A0AA37XFC2_9MICO|nr:DUF4129 domain-containing protein [Litorihabitans aurantiacus]GMA32089.1 hypothetical protein GCM10025875_20810 [Litorihabitans aurantiacus]
MHRSGATTGVLGVVLTVLVLLAAAAGAGLRGPWSADPPSASTTPTPSETPIVPTESPPSQEEETPLEPVEPPRDSGGLPSWLADVAEVVVVVAVLGAAVVLAVWLWRRRRRSAPSLIPDHAPGVTTGADHGDEPVPDLAPALTRARRALGVGAPPRDAIVAAWVSLEEAAGEAGAGRVPSDTPTEFAHAVLERTSADPEAVARLLRLYRAARFGRSQPTSDDVAAATDAIGRIEETWEGRP